METQGYRVRVHNGDFFMLSGPDGDKEEVSSLEGAIESAKEFLEDTNEAFLAGHLSSAYVAGDMEIVGPDGTVLTLELAKALVADPICQE